MKRIGFLFLLLATLSVFSFAQAPSAVAGYQFVGVDNNGTTVKKYSYDAAQTKPAQKPVFAVSDSAFVLKGKQLFGKELVGPISKFLSAPVSFSGDTTDVYDLDLDIVMPFPNQAIKLQVLEELGFVLEKVEPKQ